MTGKIKCKLRVFRVSVRIKLNCLEICGVKEVELELELFFEFSIFDPRIDLTQRTNKVFAIVCILTLKVHLIHVHMLDVLERSAKLDCLRLFLFIIGGILLRRICKVLKIFLKLGVSSGLSISHKILPFVKAHFTKTWDC